MIRWHHLPFLFATGVAVIGGCTSSRRSFGPPPPDGGDTSSFGEAPEGDPCEAAAKSKSYIGCDAWPTPVANVAWSVFDFAVVVANAGTRPANIKVERAGAQVSTATVEPNGLTKIYLPWVPELKGKDSDYCGSVLSALPASVHAAGGAYHLKSDRPVTVYQFNALEYAPVGGPAKKDWTACPGDLGCPGVSCLSYSNDASLLFPTNALTGTYRITGVASANGNSYFAVTATADGTKVKVQLSSTAKVLAGGGLAATDAKGTLEFSMNAGDVVEVAAQSGNDSDLSGSLVIADHPVQVIAGHPCLNVPQGIMACDHLEQSVLPAETLGKHYFVEQPTGPYGAVPGHVVRIYGNVDGTKLTYPQDAPKNAPATIDAGQVVDLGIVEQDFEIVGDQAFAVITLMLGGNAVDPDTNEGDPSMSSLVAVEQYRTKYVFLAPDDYDTSYVDAVHPMTTTLTLDGAPIETAATAIGTSGFGVHRIRLDDKSSRGAHVIESSEPFGLQVLGYGKSTSYQYPAGLDLEHIAPPPLK
ncbi:IgGFc-binding protein [Labilithrix luteola]|uniref:IgGFc-binding protein n=1 Tax=Labilithrix luteola TaxID=1391654 RepID=UPI0011BA603D|nr:IgGFc-binding protein [Labilithrix luteola]